jgi:addiction module HigA family antidote
MRKFNNPVNPGELLLEEFLKPMQLSQYRLAKGIGVPAQRISEIIAGRRSITADTDLRLCRFFGLSNGYWLRAQAAHDTKVTERALGPALKKAPRGQAKYGPGIYLLDKTSQFNYITV